MDTHGDYEFCVRGYESGEEGRCKFTTLCNYLQEAASMNADDLNFSKDSFAAEGMNLAWVLTRMRVKVMRYPKWREKLVITTFPRGGRRVVAYRDFIVRDAGGETVALATSEWVVLDMVSRKVVPVPEKVFALANTEREPVLPGAFAKLHWDCRSTENAVSILVGRGNIDVNAHVNNVHYIEWVTDTLPKSAYEPKEFEIVFRSETLVGETVLAESVEVEPGVWIARVCDTTSKDHVIARIASE